MTSRRPNLRLAAAMQLASVTTNKGLAALVRNESKGAIPCDHTYVKRWLDGSRPTDDTIRYIAAALGRKLGRVVSFEELGYESTGRGTTAEALHGSTHYPAEASRAVEILDGLTHADLGDGPAVMRSDWEAGTVPQVITGYLFAGPIGIDTSPASSGEVATASRIRATVRNLTQLEFQYGGGHTRAMLLSYWKSEILPALRHNYPGSARRDIFAAAADAAEVLGWNAYDAGRHGAAQRYFVQGLRLAREADDAVMGGQILSNLSHQANYLGKFDEAVHLARAAQSATLGRATATVTAMFLAMEARALASLGDARGCADVLHRAECAFERQRVDDDPDWISYFDCFELAGEAAHCFRDLGDSTQTQAFAIQAIDAVSTPTRTRSFISMVDADGALAAGKVEEALSLASASVEFAGTLQSSRYHRYLADFHARLVDRGLAALPATRDLVATIAERCPGLVLGGVS